MGWFSGSDVEETKDVENTGSVNNIVTIGHTVDIESDKISWLLSAILFLKLVELCFLGFKIYKKNLKKKYTKRVDIEMRSTPRN